MMIKEKDLKDKRCYEKPEIKLEANMNFMFQSVKKLTTKYICRQCSSCHSCR